MGNLNRIPPAHTGDDAKADTNAGFADKGLQGVHVCYGEEGSVSLWGNGFLGTSWSKLRGGINRRRDTTNMGEIIHTQSPFLATSLPIGAPSKGEEIQERPKQLGSGLSNWQLRKMRLTAFQREVV